MWMQLKPSLHRAIVKGNATLFENGFKHFLFDVYTKRLLILLLYGDKKNKHCSLRSYSRALGVNAPLKDLESDWPWRRVVPPDPDVPWVLPSDPDSRSSTGWSAHSWRWSPLNLFLSASSSESLFSSNTGNGLHRYDMVYWKIIKV